jgi:cell shape-determining protein MreC
MQDQKLSIRQVRIVFQDAQFAYIREGLEDGDHVVTTTLATVTEGLPLRRVEDVESPDDQSDRPSEEDA